MKNNYLILIPLMLTNSVYSKVTVDQKAIREMVEERQNSLKTPRLQAEKMGLEINKDLLDQSMKDNLKESTKSAVKQLKKGLKNDLKDSMGRTLTHQCAPARELIPFPTNVNTGRYYRYSPDGNKVIVSSGSIDGLNNNIGIIHISFDKEAKNAVTPIPTNMYDETYPVEGVKNENGKYEWQIMTSPFDPKAGGMGFYEFGSGTKNDVLLHGQNANHIHTDSDHDEYYHSSAAAPTASGNTTNFRVMLWSDQKMKDYKVEKNPDGTSKIIATSDTYNPCRNLRTIEGPIISKDSSMIGFTQNNQTVIYKIDHRTKKCRLVRKVGYSTGKVSFNYPGQKTVVAFGTDTSYERNGDFRQYRAIQTFDYATEGLDDIDRINNITDPAVDNAMSYAGMLADGRVMYITERLITEDDGYEDYQRFIVRADPKQLNKDGTINVDAAKNGNCTKTLQPYKRVLDKKTNDSESKAIQQ